MSTPFVAHMAHTHDVHLPSSVRRRCIFNIH